MKRFNFPIQPRSSSLKIKSLNFESKTERVLPSIIRDINDGPYDPIYCERNSYNKLPTIISINEER